MKALCSECEVRPVFVVSMGRKHREGHQEHHDLCDACYRSLRDHIVAARMMPKPSWVCRARATLQVMADQVEWPRW